MLIALKNNLPFFSSIDFAIGERVLSSYTPTTIKSESELSQFSYEIFTFVRCAIEFLN